jgi:hypothetical protein
MTLNTKVTVAASAWVKLRELPAHTHRKRAYQQFDGISYATITPNQPNGRGLSAYITELLFKQHSEYHKPNSPFSILPETFVDTREWASSDYALYGEPGVPTDFTPETFRMAKARRMHYYTMWADPDAPTEVHGLYVPNLEQITQLVATIVNYWHISTPRGCLPQSAAEAFSGFLNAIGLGYLSHPLIDSNMVIPSRHQATYTNLHYQELDKQLAEMKQQAESRASANRWTNRIRKPYIKKKPCQTIFQSEQGWPFRCNKRSEYVLRIGYVEYNVCKDCSYDRTKVLPMNSYVLERIVEEIITPPQPQLIANWDEPQLPPTKPEKKIRFKIVKPAPTTQDIEPTQEKPKFVPLTNEKSLTPEQQTELDAFNKAAEAMYKDFFPIIEPESPNNE